MGVFGFVFYNGFGVKPLWGFISINNVTIENNIMYIYVSVI